MAVGLPQNMTPSKLAGDRGVPDHLSLALYLYSHLPLRVTRSKENTSICLRVLKSLAPRSPRSNFSVNSFSVLPVLGTVDIPTSPSLIRFRDVGNLVVSQRPSGVRMYPVLPSVIQ